MFGKTTGKITFYYDSEKLFNDVSLLSAYMAKNIKGESGSLMDEYSISDDEKDMYGVCVSQAMPDIYETMMKITSNVANAFEFEFIVNIGDERKTKTDGTGESAKEVELPESINQTTGKDGNAKEGTLGRFAGKYVEFTIMNNDSYNGNVLNLVDATLYSCLKYGIISEFYAICINGDLYSLAKDKFATSLQQLKQRLFQLKKKSVSSQLS